jgi:hypothetical protein
MSDQQELRQRREALAHAVNRHDLQGVLACIHPSFACKTKWCFSVGYKDVAQAMEQLCAPGNDYKETVEIETIEVTGDSATVVTRRVEQMERGALQNRPRATRPFVFLAILFAGLTILSIRSVVLGRDQAVVSLVATVVASLGCVCWEFYQRRAVNRALRYRETWRRSEGRWLMVEEQEL